MTKEQQVKEILLKALRYEWDSRDNKNTVESRVNEWVEEIARVFEKRG